MFNPAADSVSHRQREGYAIQPKLNAVHASTLQDLKAIVTKNQGAEHETSAVVRQMEQLLSDLERKAENNKKSLNDLPLSLPPSAHQIVV
jgi:hypothetical protein